jgi:hypothetical protein
MWILKNSKDLLDSLKSRSFSQVSSIKTFDFSTLYTTLPHDIFLEDKHNIVLHLSILYDYQHFFQHPICFSIQPQLQLVNLHRNRRYFVIKLHTWFWPTSFDKDEILANHRSFMTSLNIPSGKESEDLPYLYWIPKLHKTPYKERYNLIRHSK